MPKKAVILGASGLVGSYVLDLLLQDSRYNKIIAVGRRPLGFTHEKLEEVSLHLVEEDISYNHLANANELYCCIGTTATLSPDPVKYRAIDYGIPVHAARAAEEQAISTLIVVSSIGANAKSRSFYLRTKGEMEEVVMKTNIERKIIVRPSLILGKRSDDRKMESFVQNFSTFVNPLLFGRLKKYQSIHAQRIALALVFMANGNYPSGIYESDQLQDLADKALSVN